MDIKSEPPTSPPPTTTPQQQQTSGSTSPAGVGGWASKLKGVATGIHFPKAGEGYRSNPSPPPAPDQQHLDDFDGGDGLLLHHHHQNSEEDRRKAATGPGVMSKMASAASAAGSMTGSKISSLKSAVASFDKYMEASLFEATLGNGESSPLKQQPISINVRKVVANDPGPTATTTTTTISSPATTTTGMKQETSFNSLISLAADKTSSVLKSLAGGSYHEDQEREGADGRIDEEEDGGDDDDREDEGAVGWTGKKAKNPTASPGERRPSLVWSPQKEKAAAAMLKELELVHGTVLTLLHRQHGQPLAALDDSLRASVFATWSRIHLDSTYWTAEDGYLSPSPPSPLSLDRYTIDTIDLPALRNRSFYKPTSDDAGCFIMVELETRGGTVSQRLLAGPIEIDASVRSAVKAAVAKPTYITDKGTTLHVSRVGGIHTHSGFSETTVAPQVEVEVTGREVRIESVNADTSRGFRIHLASDMQVKTSPVHPASLQLLLPVRDGAVTYYGDRSGELASFISLTSPAPKHVRANSKEDSDDDDDDNVVEGTPTSGGPERVAMTIRLPTVLAREVLVSYLRLVLLELQRPLTGSKARADLLPWTAWEHAENLRAEAAAVEAERARRALVEETEKARTRCARLTSELQAKEAEAQGLRDSLTVTKSQLEQVSGEKERALEEARASSEQAKALEQEAIKVKQEAEAAVKACQAKAEETENAAQDELIRLRTEVASAKKKSESLAKELKAAIATGGGATAVSADRAKVQELEKRLEAAHKEIEAYKQALERTLQSIGRT